MKDFNKLEMWSPERDTKRRIQAGQLLEDNGIEFYMPSKGHYKIKSKNQLTIMFYPKSAKIVWKKNKKDRQHIFFNEDSRKIIKHLNKII